MPVIIRQTIKHKKLSFWKVIFMIFATIAIMEVGIKVFSEISPVVGTIGGLGVLMVALGVCTMVIYQHICQFNYKLIGDELIMERIFWKTNPVSLSVKLSELREFKPYREVNMKDLKGKNVKLHKFVLGRNKDHWYIGEINGNNSSVVIIEPNEELLKAIRSFNNK